VDSCVCICHVCALTLLSDVCIPAVVDQEAGLREVENMVLVMLHLLAEPYSESCSVVDWSVPFINWENMFRISLLMCTTDHDACDLMIQFFFFFCRSQSLHFWNRKLQVWIWSMVCTWSPLLWSDFCCCKQCILFLWAVSFLLLLTTN